MMTKFEKKWLEVFHKCCDLFGENGHTGNRVKLILGQFDNDDQYGIIELSVTNNLTFLDKYIKFCKKNELDISFRGEHYFELRPNERFKKLIKEARKWKIKK